MLSLSCMYFYFFFCSKFSLSLSLSLSLSRLSSAFAYLFRMITEMQLIIVSENDQKAIIRKQVTVDAPCEIQPVYVEYTYLAFSDRIIQHK